MNNQTTNKLVLFDLGSLTVYGHCPLDKPMSVQFFSWTDVSLNVSSATGFVTLSAAINDYKAVKQTVKPSMTVHSFIELEPAVSAMSPNFSNDPKIIYVDFKQKRRLK